MKLRQALVRPGPGSVVIALTILTAMMFWDGALKLRTPDQRGYAHFVNQEFDQASIEFLDTGWQAAAFYRNGAFKEAGSLFAGEDTAEGAFNQGNALIFQGRYEEATERYDRALQLKPGWERAEINREIATARAAALHREGGDMTGGQLGADEIVFDSGTSQADGDEVSIHSDLSSGDKDMRAIWLRQVQTRPADFLRSKFAFQQRQRAAGD